MSEINRLWNNTSEAEWQSAVKIYDDFITSSIVAQLDAEIDPIDPNSIAGLTSQQWFHFLYDKYFPWKYTAPNRLATTRMSLSKHRDCPNGLSDLKRIKDGLVNGPVEITDYMLKLATEIGGLGVAGASGLGFYPISTDG